MIMLHRDATASFRHWQLATNTFLFIMMAMIGGKGVLMMITAIVLKIMNLQAVHADQCSRLQSLQERVRAQVERQARNQGSLPTAVRGLG